MTFVTPAWPLAVALIAVMAAATTCRTAYTLERGASYRACLQKHDHDTCKWVVP